MKTFIIAFLLLNISILSAYLYGADSNRLLCMILWVVAPFANLITYGLLQNRA